MSEYLPTINVVDDDPAVRRSLVRLLHSAGYHANSFASADEFFRFWEQHPSPGCVLLDIYMPGLDGLQLQQKLRISVHAIPVIFMTGKGDVPSSVRAMKAGAVDFLPKPLDGEKLLKAVQEAVERDRRERKLRSELSEAKRRFEKLTPREYQVMSLVVRGLLNKQIAAELGLSEKTVKIHRGQVMRKLKVPSVPDLVRLAIRIGLKGESRPA